jgi:stage III sporulation protein AG
MSSKGPLDWLKEKFLDNKDNMPPGKKSGKHTYLLILLLLGAAFMLIGNMWKNTSENKAAQVVQEENAVVSHAEAFGHKQQEKNNDMKVYEEQYENQLKEALEEIVGVRDVTVIVNVEATEQKVFERNTTLKNQTTNEQDKEGGTRQVEDQSQEEQLVTVREGDEEVPVIIETKKPVIRGVLVVAGGAENMTVKNWIIESVTRVLDVPSHKVAVMPKKSKGDS